METSSVENLVEKMEIAMKNADSKLELLSMRMDLFESRMIIPDDNEDKQHDAGTSQATNGLQSSAGSANKPHTEEETSTEKTVANDVVVVDDDDDDDGIDPRLVRELLSDVKRVRCEYDQLHDEIRQVQVLQQEVTRSVRKQMRQVQSHFDDLRGRIIGSGGGGSLPPK